MGLIRPNNYRPQPDVPVDDESGGVITNSYLWNATTGEWEPGTINVALGTDQVFIRRISDGTVINPARDETLDSILAKLDAGVDVLNFPDRLTNTQLRASAVPVDDDESQVLLTSILADLAGKRDGTETQAVFTSSPVSAKIGAGKFFLFSSTRSVLAGTEATWSLANPAGSGKVIYIIHVGAYNDNTAQIRFNVFKNSTITGGTVRVPFDPNFATNSVSSAVVIDGEGIRSGGTQLEGVVPVTRDKPYQFDGLLILPPGTSLQLTGIVPGTLTNQQLTVGARWYEE